MMPKKFRWSLVMVFSGWIGLAGAAPVTYILEGDLKTVRGLDYYHLGDSHFVWTITSDTDYLFESNVSNAGMRVGSGFSQWDSSVMVLSNRPGSTPDLTTTVSSTVTATDVRSTASNWNSLSGMSNDTYDFTSAHLDEIPYLDWQGPTFYFGLDYWEDDEVPLLPTDFSNLLDQSWRDWDGQPQRAVSYRPTNWTITAQVVPIPGTAWLFISALGGLVVAKRKQLKA